MPGPPPQRDRDFFRLGWRQCFFNSPGNSNVLKCGRGRSRKLLQRVGGEIVFVAAKPVRSDPTRYILKVESLGLANHLDRDWRSVKKDHG